MKEFLIFIHYKELMDFLNYILTQYIDFFAIFVTIFLSLLYTIIELNKNRKLSINRIKSFFQDYNNCISDIISKTENKVLLLPDTINIIHNYETFINYNWQNVRCLFEASEGGEKKYLNTVLYKPVNAFHTVTKENCSKDKNWWQDPSNIFLVEFCSKEFSDGVKKEYDKIHSFDIWQKRVRCFVFCITAILIIGISVAKYSYNNLFRPEIIKNEVYSYKVIQFTQNAMKELKSINYSISKINSIEDTIKTSIKSFNLSIYKNPNSSFIGK